MQLVINTFGASLRKEGDRFLIQAGGKQVALLGKTDMPRVVETKQLWADEPSPAVQLPEESDDDEAQEKSNRGP